METIGLPKKLQKPEGHQSQRRRLHMCVWDFRGMWKHDRCDLWSKNHPETPPNRTTRPNIRDLVPFENPRVHLLGPTPMTGRRAAARRAGQYLEGKRSSGSSKLPSYQSNQLLHCLHWLLHPGYQVVQRCQWWMKHAAGTLTTHSLWNLDFLNILEWVDGHPGWLYIITLADL